jgi:hypothetical protein
MYTITNLSKAGPRGFYVVDEDGNRERVSIPAGGSITRELSEAQAEKLDRWDNLKVRPVAEGDGGEEGVTRRISVRKAGKKFAVFVNGKQDGEPTTKAAADKAAQALREAPEE